MYNLKDCLYGKKCEKDCFKFLNHLSNGRFIKLHEFSVLDFVSHSLKIYVEVKGRRIEKNKYNSSLVAFNKWEESKRKNRIGYRVIHVWAYKDGMYFYEYNKKHKFDAVSFYVRNKPKKFYAIPNDIVLPLCELEL
tara:strand:+ start:924 stop:1331 length:408 start_codon:yes stop_codon:yes gene_type:complete